MSCQEIIATIHMTSIKKNSDASTIFIIDRLLRLRQFVTARDKMNNWRLEYQILLTGRAANTPLAPLDKNYDERCAKYIPTHTSLNAVAWICACADYPPTDIY